MEENIKDDQVKKYKNNLFEWVEALIVAIFFVIFIFIFIARPVGVSGSSMEPTLSNGDNLIISNFMYAPKKGDIIVLAKDTFENGEKSIVKRIIATEGQTVDIDFEKGEVYVDGVQLNEPYINEKTYLYEGVDFPVVVPEDNVFVLGDNRNHSSDSRSIDIGMIPKDCILGRVVFRMLPFSEMGTVE